MTAPMTREEVLKVVRQSRRRGERPELSGLDLRRLGLSGLDLTWTDLSGTDLSGADLSRTYLYGANLTGTNLTGTNLTGTYIRGTSSGVLAVDGLPSGPVRMAPTPAGWALRVGCWGDGTADYGPGNLRHLIAGDDWPDAEDDEQDRRRPGLTAVADLCEAHIAANPAFVPTLAKYWSETTDRRN